MAISRQEYQREYYRKNKEKRSEYFKKHYQENKEKIKERNNRRYAENKKLKESKQSSYDKYYEEHKDERKEYYKKHYEENKEIFDQIGWSSNDHYLFYTFNFGDENIFSGENLQKILDNQIQKNGYNYLNMNIKQI